MQQWYMLTVVGEDQPGIVSAITQALFDNQCNLGEASMMRLGGNFTIMLMVQSDHSASGLETVLVGVTRKMGLRLHVDAIEGRLHQHKTPDVQIAVFGADRAGIVAQVTGALAEAGLDILDLNSDVAGRATAPIYIMQIQGVATRGVEALQQAIDAIDDDSMDVRIEAIDTLVG
ncbi:MAG: amino acid-binding protein [Gammaproteobacteria bacterium]|nr:amino acid-binding protein [Gammaproteobacteria bacterium]